MNSLAKGDEKMLYFLFYLIYGDRQPVIEINENDEIEVVWEVIPKS